MATGIRKAGEFCWINMITPEPEEARAFYARVLGWSYFEIPGLGYGMEVGGSKFGGLFDLNGPNVPTGTIPHIGVMVKVESADAACARVNALGGTATPASDIRDQGRMACLFDPNGARFDVWEPRKQPGTDVDHSLHGAPSWFETLTTDVDRASVFYSALFGWTPEANPMPGFTYTVFRLGPDPVAGMMPILPEMGPLPPHWLVYFTVADIDATARDSVALGATLCGGIHDVPGVGRFGVLRSPQGVTFAAIESSR